jgi:hypothetical protein
VIWTPILNRTIKVIDPDGPARLSGGQFIRMMQEVDPYLSDYSQFIEERRLTGKSTTRRDFFRDILTEFNEGQRYAAMQILLKHIEIHEPEVAAAIRGVMGSGVPVPAAAIPITAWNGTRLKEALEQIDAAIATGNQERAVTLCYSTLEGFLGAFVRAKEVREEYPNEILDLSKEVRDYLRKNIAEYPSEVLNLITTIAFATDRARNQFSEAHFGKEAGQWLATYLRDLLNSQIRLLLHFM